jgi:hypothetical protein
MGMGMGMGQLPYMVYAAPQQPQPGQPTPQIYPMQPQVCTCPICCIGLVPAPGHRMMVLCGSPFLGDLPWPRLQQYAGVPIQAGPFLYYIPPQHLAQLAAQAQAQGYPGYAPQGVRYYTPHMPAVYSTSPQGQGTQPSLGMGRHGRPRARHGSRQNQAPDQAGPGPGAGEEEGEDQAFSGGGGEEATQHEAGQ